MDHNSSCPHLHMDGRHQSHASTTIKSVLRILRLIVHAPKLASLCRPSVYYTMSPVVWKIRLTNNKVISTAARLFRTLFCKRHFRTKDVECFQIRSKGRHHVSLPLEDEKPWQLGHIQPISNLRHPWLGCVYFCEQNGLILFRQLLYFRPHGLARMAFSREKVNNNSCMHILHHQLFQLLFRFHKHDIFWNVTLTNPFALFFLLLAQQCLHFQFQLPPGLCHRFSHRQGVRLLILGRLSPLLRQQHIVCSSSFPCRRRFHLILSSRG
mmetsp:Transcript_3106/g.6303  ORF Transcript_3106/g.6303 Transcript_3106/m.6303 type:complete len:267 (+) Transcript_3106:174-974(+)